MRPETQNRTLNLSPVAASVFHFSIVNTPPVSILKHFWKFSTAIIRNYYCEKGLLTSIIKITPMNAECRLLNKFHGGQFNRAVFASICRYLPVNTAGMEKLISASKSTNLA